MIVRLTPITPWVFLTSFARCCVNPNEKNYMASLWIIDDHRPPAFKRKQAWVALVNQDLRLTRNMFFSTNLGHKFSALDEGAAEET